MDYWPAPGAKLLKNPPAITLAQIMPKNVKPSMRAAEMIIWRKICPAASG